MIVVADAGPLHYLVLIKVVDVLQPLYRRVLVPQTVAGELQETNTPAAVRAWIEQPPEWFEIRPGPPSEEALWVGHRFGRLRNGMGIKGFLQPAC
jgi:predicted nucleic acid-binding protein